MARRQSDRAVFLGLMLLIVHSAALVWMWMQVGPPEALRSQSPVWDSVLLLDAPGMYLYVGVIGDQLTGAGWMTGLLLAGGLQWLLAGMCIERLLRRFVLRPIAGRGAGPITPEDQLRRESLRVRRTGRA